MSAPPPTLRFAFDIGGTFTDLVLLAGDGVLYTAKVLSEAGAVVDPILMGLHRLCEAHRVALEQIDEVVVGATTAVTNLVIERKGARTALITTQGFRDVLAIGRELRYDLYDLLAPGPDPVIPRALRHEIRERTDASGRILCAPDPQAVQRLARALKAEDVHAVAVCLLHSYSNPANEVLVGEVLASAYPELCVSLSHQVLAELREYERSVATVLNAYVMPKVGHYLRSIEEGLRGAGVQAALRVMQSNGGVISRGFGERFPIRLLESGPAAGALGAAHSACKLGLDQVLAFDMGGTTAKACLVSEGQPGMTHDFEAARTQRFKRGSGLPVRLPTVDLLEIGAGGGSIARVDGTGLIKVGPDSAGSAPGPACYGLGGDRPTVTDAALLLGYLDPQATLSGAVQLRHDLAEKAVRLHLAEPLGLSVTEAASGVHRIVCEQMAAAAKVHAVEKAKDLRKATLFAFGGAGPLHAREVARRLRTRDLIVPSSAGVFSAFGLLVAPMKVDQVRTWFTRLDALLPDEAEAMLGEMEEQLRAELIRTPASAVQTMHKAEHNAPQHPAIRFVRSADIRYVGQGFEVSTPLPDRFAAGVAEPGSVAERRSTQASPEAVLQVRADIQRAFEEVYARHFGAHLHRAPIEILNWRVEAYADRAGDGQARADARLSADAQAADDHAATGAQAADDHAATDAQAARDARSALLQASPAFSRANRVSARSRRAFFPCQGQWLDTPVVDADALESERSFSGPALIEQPGSTVVVGPGDAFLRDALGNIRIRVAG